MGLLENRTAVITGGAQGIGKAAAERFSAEGANVYIFDINREAGERTAAEINRIRSTTGSHGNVRFLACDVSAADEVEKCLESVFDSDGRLDVVYNNASVYLPGKDGKITDIAEDIWDRVLAINLKSIYLFCRFGIPLMVKTGGGSIINTASSAGVLGIPNCDAYTATKGATVALTRSLAVEYGPQHIRVNCIAPAGIKTPMLNQSNLEDNTFDENRFLKLRSPSRRYGTPEEIAAIAVFLASDESSYINGAVITADGGITVNGDLSRLKEEM